MTCASFFGGLAGKSCLSRGFCARLDQAPRNLADAEVRDCNIRDLKAMVERVEAINPDVVVITCTGALPDLTAMQNAPLMSVHH